MKNTRKTICLVPVDDVRGASTRYRVLAYVPSLEKGGYEPRVRTPLGLRGTPRSAWRLADLTRDTFFLRGENLLFLHRKMYPPWFAARLRRPGRRIVFDMDDALELPPPGRSSDEATLQRYRENFDATVRAADLVLCGNRELARRLPANAPPHELFATPIDTDRFRPGLAEPVGETRLGWVGHSDNLPYLERIAEPLRELTRRHAGLKLVVVADRPPKLAGVDIVFRRWSLETEVTCFLDMGIGLMPLEDTPWARAKCAFKAIQYMALGIPAVASPVGMNREVIEHGVSGFLPETETDWVEALHALLSRPDLRTRIGLAGRERVEQRYSLARHSDRLLVFLDRLTLDRPDGRS